MRFLLDSHTLLWAMFEPHRLSEGVANVVSDGANSLYISHVSILELTDKAAKFRLPSAGSSVERIMERILKFGAEIVAIELVDVLASVQLPLHHGGPLDRLLIAQAQRLQATLLSRDGKSVCTMWRPCGSSRVGACELQR